MHGKHYGLVLLSDALLADALGSLSASVLPDHPPNSNPASPLAQPPHPAPFDTASPLTQSPHLRLEALPLWVQAVVQDATGTTLGSVPSVLSIEVLLATLCRAEVASAPICTFPLTQ